jgi:uncharacterized protein with LGFP repeats
VWLTVLGVVVSLLSAAPAEAVSEPATDPTTSAVQADTATGTATGTASVASMDLSVFQAGNIIGDAVFFNRTTMTEAQIQSFFQAKVPVCQSGYVCLKDWYDTSRTTRADAMCAAYSGGIRERASRIVHKVALACGINPQVLIVMLQKEQGLVTHTWPSTFRYTLAMGQGCPDTAACDTRYYGFFNQVYGAAWQLKRYANPAGTSAVFTWYAPGSTWNVRYNPSTACGTGPVLVKNQATANLYYYTPYQPNYAALRAGYGAGDSCSSYGNRNFFNYFTDWFGSTQYTATGAFATEWKRVGGATGQLGNPISSATWVSANGGGFIQRFQKGEMWLRSGSSTAVSMGLGPFLTNYLSAGAQSGSWGWPTAAARCGLSGSGCSMIFQHGTTYYSAATGSKLVLKGMDAAYLALGGPSSRYGYPSAVAKAGPNGGAEQDFVHGTLVFSPATGIQPVAGATLATWRAAGAMTGSLGYPTAAPVAVAANGGGTVQEFTGGTIWASPAGGFAMSAGPLRVAYLTAGGPAGAWGWPTGKAACGLAGGGCTMAFQRGVVAWTPTGGSVLVPVGPVLDGWNGTGAAAGSLGYPTAAAVAVAANGGGLVQQFAGGTVWGSPSGGFAMGPGAFRAGYLAAGGPAGAWGWPAGKAMCRLTGGGCTMAFQKGLVAYSPATGSVLVPLGPILTGWNGMGGVAGSLGYPKSAPVAIAAGGGGAVQEFTGGTIWGSPAGGFAMGPGAFRTNYLTAGGPAGAWGWPTGKASCGLAGGGCTMAFQKGVVAYSTATGSVLVPKGPILGAWTTRGGVAGALGYPKASAVTKGTVTTQTFQHGTVKYDSATGVVTVS